MWIGTVIVLTGAFLLLAAGCGEQQQIRDLEDITQTEPDKVRLVTNVDQYPNVVAICVEGEGFITTTRDYDPITHIPAWGGETGWCSSE